MSMDAIASAFREMPAVSAVPQLSLTRTDRELQMEEGLPPMEVASTEQEALRWRKEEVLREKCKKRQEQRRARHEGSQDETISEAQNLVMECNSTDEEASLVQPLAMQENMEAREEEETGTLFDGRS